MILTLWFTGSTSTVLEVDSTNGDNGLMLLFNITIHRV